MTQIRDNVEAIYPLSPMQEGMLFHNAYDPASEVHVGQTGFNLEGDLDVAAFKWAWRAVTDRHPALRTLFVWERREKPLQVVRPRVEPPFEELDWRGLTAVEQRARLEEFLAADRRRGFDFAQAPLMRLALIRLGERTHRLIWSRHHIIIDGWSLPLVLNELFALYRARTRGEEPALGASRPYRDYIGWLQKQDLGAAESYWRETLRGFNAPTPLRPGGAQRAEAAGRRFDSQSFRLDEAATARLHAFAQRQQLTLNTLVQGAWALLLSRHSGEQDVVFGVTVSGRPAELAGIEKMVGLFINTLPVRARIDASEPAVAWLRRMQEQQAEMRQFEYSPLVQVQRWSELPPRLPLFESIFVFENYPAGDGQGRGENHLKMSDVAHFERTHYPLAVVAAAGPRLLLRMVYDASLFEHDAVARMLRQLETLLAGIAADPERRLDDFSPLPEEERRTVLFDWNRTEADYPRSRGVHELFAEQAARTPGALAAADGTRQLTYGELEARANQLAHHLIEAGARTETPVGVLLDRSTEMVVGLLGVLKAGAAYLPLDTSYPPERIRLMLEDSGARLLVTERRHADALCLEGVRAVCLDADAAAIDRRSPQDPQGGATPDHLAYVIYTSGSTGRPKGVCVSHRNLLNLVHWHREAFAVTARDRATQLAGTSFDASVWELWPYLTAGASIHMPDEETRLTPGPLRDWLVEQSITITFLPTPLAEQVLALPWPREAALRTLLTGGDRLQKHPPEGLPFQLVNNYGPTECTVVATSGPVAGVGPDGVAPSIGRPVSNARAYILDRRMRPVPAGVQGELYVGGEGVARGYLHRAALTAERFVPDAYSGEPGARLYRTGDLVRHSAEGEIEFSGRADHQLKLRGYRIEPGEIESALAGAGVAAAAVVAHDFGPGERRLVAYVVANGGGPLDDARLRAHLRERLPEYMVPSHFMLLDSLPLTPNGKVDRKALPAPDAAHVGAGADFVPPRDAVEEAVASIWQEVLGAESVGAFDDFFELGGHSLSAARVVTRLRKALGVALPLGDLFEQPTVAGLAARVRTLTGATADGVGQMSESGSVVIERCDGPPYPLSYQQRRLWFLDQLHPGSCAYNVPVALRLTGRVDVSALAGAVEEVARRHEVLRTRFPAHRGEAVAEVCEEATVRLAFEELTGVVGEEARRRAALEAARAEMRRPFDLARGPVMRALLSSVSETEHVLCVVAHHIAADGWSLGLLLAELGRVYGELAGGGVVTGEGAGALRYGDYAAWQRGLGGGWAESEIEFWRRELAGSPRVLELGPARVRGRASGQGGATRRIGLGASLSEGVRALGRREGATLFMTLLAAFDVLLHHHSSREEILVGVDVANRDRGEVENIVGLFVNQVVMRTDLSGDPTFQELLVRVREMTLRVYAHQEFPFDRVVDGLKIERELGRNPLFQVMFGLQNLPRWQRQWPGLTLTPLPVETETTIFDLSLYMADTPEELIGWVRYSTELFDEGVVARLVEDFETLLRVVVERPAVRLGELRAALAEGERRRDLARRNENKEAARKILKSIRPQPITG